jgi:HEAT repeat protein
LIKTRAPLKLRPNCFSSAYDPLFDELGVFVMTGPAFSTQSIHATMKKLTLFLCGALWLLGFSACSTTDQQVSDLLEQLAANEIETASWQQAVDELAAIGRPAARQLVAHLNPDHYKGVNYREYRSEQEKLRTGAARALGRIKPRGATVALDDRIVVAYTDNERIACIWAIGEIGFNQTGLDALKAQLKDKNPLIRLHAAIGIVKMDEENGIEEIEAALNGDDDQLVKIALHGLEESNYFGVPSLSRFARQSGPNQEQLRQVVGQVKDQLVSQLAAEEPTIRQRSARALGTIGDRSASDGLLQLLEDPNNLVRFNAAAALATMDASQGIDFLFAALQNEDPILRANAVKFLTQVQRSSGAVEGQLLEALSSDSPLSRSGAAQVLGEARVSGAVQALLTATADAVAEVRCNAIIALGQIGPDDIRDRLQALCEDSDPTVSYYAEWALQQLGQS